MDLIQVVKKDVMTSLHTYSDTGCLLQPTVKFMETQQSTTIDIMTIAVILGGEKLLCKD